MITSIEICSSVIPLKKPFIISLERLDAAENIIVIIRTRSGLSGQGECSPFKTINGESMETCRITGRFIATALIGKNALDIQACLSIADQVIYGNSSIKSAFDIALHDIAAQAAGIPLYKYLGGFENKNLVTDYTVSIGSPSQMADDARAIRDAGFSIIKVKLGDAAQDYSRIEAIRNMIGLDIPLRIDANQGWNVQDALMLLNAFKDFNIQFCEEPVPRTDFTDLPYISSNSPIPVMADESCWDHHDAARLCSMHACRMFNIKTGKSGIYKSMKIARIAEEHNIMLQAGGFLESRLGFTAAAHMALAGKQFIYYDFDTPLMLAQDPVAGGIRYKAGGIVTVPEEPGLGAAFEDSYLENLPKEIISS